jgi:glycosyltransferase involved in cell wall biosynthesis
LIELSVVLISKNQAWNISGLIESILAGASCVSSSEIILVDSASTDETVERAGPYPISILRLLPGQRLSPAIGRYVGFQQTQGEYILFLDGDTRLIPEWLPHALRVMREAPDAGAVTGRVINLPTSAAVRNLPAPVQRAQMAPPKEVLWCSYGGGGVGLYRRTVLDEVGTFNPHLSSEEEPELGLRIRHAGYRILELDHPVAFHYNDAPVAFSSVMSRRNRNFHLGLGQAARYHLSDNLFWPWLKERWWEPGAALLLAAGLAASLLSLITYDFAWFGLWIFGLSLLLAVVAFRKQSLRGALVAGFNWFVMGEGFVRGFVMRPSPVETFHAEVQVIKPHPDIVISTVEGRASRKPALGDVEGPAGREPALSLSKGRPALHQQAWSEARRTMRSGD